MVDRRLDSGHLGLCPRRQGYRRAREALLGARGWLTLVAERAQGFLGEDEDGPALLPDQLVPVLPGSQFLLIDQQTGAVHPLQTGLNTLGRLPSNDIVLEEICISRRHGVLLVHAWGGCELHDTASLNGTYVNDVRVSGPVRLASGDRIRMGSRWFLLVSAKDYQGELEDGDHPDTALE